MTRPKRHDTPDDILARARRQQAAEHKAATSPDELTDDDIEELTPATVSRLAATGALLHLGVPAKAR